MSLNDLDLDQLNRLGATLAVLMDAGRVLQSHDLAPRFDLTPGEEAVITVSFVMPGLDPMIEDDMPDWQLRDTRDVSPFEIVPGLDICRPNTCSTEAASGPADAVAGVTQPAPVESPPVDQPPTDLSGAPGGDPLPSAEQNAKGVPSGPVPQETAAPESVAESGGGQDMAAPAPPAAPVSGSASALAASHRGNPFANPPWTEEEDARLIDLVVRGYIGLNLSRRQAIIAAAREMGRAEGGAEFRCKTKLKARLDAALDVAAKSLAHTLALASPAAAQQDAKSDPAEDSAVGGDTPAAVHTTDPAFVEVVAATFDRPMLDVPDDLHGDDLLLWQFLQQNRPKWPMTAGTDLDLVVAMGRGEKLPVIAVDLGFDTQALLSRYRTLTSRVVDARGHVSIEGGPRLIKLLRRIAKTPAKAAA